MTARNTAGAGSRPLSALVVVMAKEPRPGHVKTRLCPPLSADMAARCHEAFVADTLARVSAVVAGRADRELAVAPSGAAPRLRALAVVGGWRCVDQEGEDLGARMQSRLVAGVAEGKKRVILLGADSPDLPAERILGAFAALEEAEVVLGPAIDGGYYLIGCRDRVPDVFGEGIAWGGAAVLKDTVARLDASGTSVALLDPWPDVDDWRGLVALSQRLREARETVANPAPKATISLLAELARQGLAL